MKADQLKQHRTVEQSEETKESPITATIHDVKGDGPDQQIFFVLSGDDLPSSLARAHGVRTDRERPDESRPAGRLLKGAAELATGKTYADGVAERRTARFERGVARLAHKVDTPYRHAGITAVKYTVIVGATAVATLVLTLFAQGNLPKIPFIQE